MAFHISDKTEKYYIIDAPHEKPSKDTSEFTHFQIHTTIFKSSNKYQYL